MPPQTRYQYGWSLKRLIGIALASALGAGVCYFLATDAQPRQIGAPHDAAVMTLAASALVGVVIYHVYLVARRVAFPQFVVADDAVLRVPKNVWGPQTHSIAFADVQKVVGPRAGKLELRGPHASVFLEAVKFNSTQEFQACCDEVARRSGFTLDVSLGDAAGDSTAAPAYIQLGKSFSTARFTTFYGAAIVSADALFLVRLKNAPVKYKSITEGVSSAIERIGGKTFPEIPITDLPPAVLDHRDWPLWDNDGTVRIIPRAVIQKVRTPWWDAFAFHAEGHIIKIPVSMWKTRRQRQQLQALGWPV